MMVLITLCVNSCSECRTVLFSYSNTLPSVISNVCGLAWSQILLHLAFSPYLYGFVVLLLICFFMIMISFCCIILPCPDMFLALCVKQRDELLLPLVVVEHHVPMRFSNAHSFCDQQYSVDPVSNLTCYYFRGYMVGPPCWLRCALFCFSHCKLSELLSSTVSSLNQGPW